jgi:hypothetical protein
MDSLRRLLRDRAAAAASGSRDAELRACLKIGAHHHDQGDFEAARKMYAQAADLGGNNDPSYHRCLADLYNAMNEVYKERSHRQQYLRIAK